VGLAEELDVLEVRGRGGVDRDEDVPRHVVGQDVAVDVGHAGVHGHGVAAGGGDGGEADVEPGAAAAVHLRHPRDRNVASVGGGQGEAVEAERGQVHGPVEGQLDAVHGPGRAAGGGGQARRGHGELQGVQVAGQLVGDEVAVLVHHVAELVLNVGADE